MSVNKIFYTEYEKNGTPFRLEVRPRPDSTLDDFDEPEYVEITTEFEFQEQDPEQKYGFEKIPVGRADSASRTVKFNFSKCSSEFRGVIRDYFANVNFLYDFYTTPETEAMLITNVWTVYSNYGTDDVKIEFQGVQRKTPATEFEEDAGGDLHCTLTLISIDSAVMEQLIPRRVYNGIFVEPEESELFPQYEIVEHEFLFDVLYKDVDADFVYGHVQRSFRTSGTDTPEIARMVRLVDVFACIYDKLEQIYRVFMREDIGFSVNALGVRTAFEDYFTEAYLVTPFSHWTFYKQSFEQAGGAAGALYYDSDYGTSNHTNVWLVGEITKSGTALGGFLSPESELLFKYPNIWEFYKDICGQAACKMTFYPSYNGTLHSLNLRYAPIGLPVSDTVITRAKQKNGTGTKTSEGANSIYEASAEVHTDGSGADSVAATVNGVLSDESVTIQALLSQQPRAKDGDYYYLQETGDNSIQTFTMPFTVIGETGFSEIGLFYLATPTFLDVGESLMMALHPYCQVNSGFESEGTYKLYEPATTVWPWGTPDVGGDPTEEADAWFTGSIQENITLIQTTACLPYVACLALLSMFKDPKQFTIEDIEVDYSTASYEDLGARVGYEYRSPDTLELEEADAIITNVEPNRETGLSTISIVRMLPDGL